MPFIMAINIQMNIQINIHDILNRVEYLNKYINEYSFKFLNIFECSNYKVIQSSFLDVLDIHLDIHSISEHFKRIFMVIF